MDEKAMKACPFPFTAISSISTTMVSSKIPNIDYPEDLCFSSDLIIINAHISNAIDSTLFTKEMIFSESAMQCYLNNNNVKDDVIKHRLVKQDCANTMTMLISMHKK